MTLRVNARHTTATEYQTLLASQDIAARLVEPDALILERPMAVERLPKFNEGWVSVQDAGAQLAAQLLDVHDGMRVLDACAAPGGKSAHLLELATSSWWRWTKMRNVCGVCAKICNVCT